MSVTAIAGPIPEGGPELHDWLAMFWDYHAGLQTDASERERCEDAAWDSCRLAASLRRALAQQEAA
jgi:hypothetical protein